MNRFAHNPARRAGFTIVELLVAVSLLVVMMFLINILFVQTTSAVSQGVRTSTVLATARSTGDRIARDGTAMLGPNRQNPAPEGGGYIIIINKEVNAPVRRPDGSEFVETFRVDQLVFMASAQTASSRAKRFRSAAPPGAGGYGSNLESPYALVRYSHGRRTERNGNDNPTFTELGQPFVFGDPRLSGREAGLDRLANDWILARQAVLFDPFNNFPGGVPASPFDWYTNTPWVNEVVQNSGGNLMYQGQTDVTVIPPAGDAAGPDPGFVDSALDPNNPGLTPAQIEQNYLALTHVFERLRVNPLPADDANNFEAALVGQTHAIFAPNCSDFIVQFAADANNDGEVDRVGPGGLNDGTEANGDPIYWYDMDTIDRLDGNFDGNVADLWGTTDWTGTTVPSPYVNIAGAPYNAAHGDHAFIFRYEDDQAYTETAPGVGDVDNSKWPYLIRIRYRLHDAPGKLEDNATFRRLDNKDQDLDGTADNEREEIVSGRYFEQIIRVPRPE